MWWLIGAAAAGCLDLALVEVHPRGSASRMEFVEFVHGGPDGWVEGLAVESATKPENWDEHADVGRVWVAAGERLVLADPLLRSFGGARWEVPAGLGLHDASRGADGVRWTCNGVVQGTVLYGSGDPDGFLADPSHAVDEVVPAPAAGESIVKVRATGTPRLDWELGDPTPGYAPGESPRCEPSSALDVRVRINEFAPNPVGPDAGHEWVELVWSGDQPVDLSGWQIERASSPRSWQSRATLVGVMGSGDYLVVGGPESGADLLLESSLGLYAGESSADAVRLVDCAGVVSDTVVYGPPDPPFFDNPDGGLHLNTAPSPGSGIVLARREDGVATGDLGEDWVATGHGTPGAPNPLWACQQGGLVINEFMANPSGADAEAARDWVELFNPQDEPLGLAGWTLETEASAAAFDLIFRGDPRHVVPARGHLVVSAEQGPGDWLTPDFDLRSGAGGDSLVLRSCSGAVQDSIAYGGENQDGIQDEFGEFARHLLPAPSDDEVFARRADGLDTNRPSADFVSAAYGTPGEPNPDYRCEEWAGAPVAINEFLPNPVGVDAETGAEFVELLNSGQDRLLLQGWQLATRSHADRPWDVVWTFASGIAIESGSYHLVSTVQGLPGGTGGDALALLDCSGELVDSVVFGGANDDLHLEDDGRLAADLSGLPAEGQCVARYPDGVDTSHSGSDTRVLATCTPGAPNVSAESEQAATGCAGGSASGLLFLLAAIRRPTQGPRSPSRAAR